MWHKQGVSTLEETLGHVLLAVILILALAGAVLKITDNTKHQQEVLAREIALSHDTLAAFPDQTKLFFPNLPESTVSFQEPCSISITQAKQQFPIKINCAQTAQKIKTEAKENGIQFCTGDTCGGEKS